MSFDPLKQFAPPAKSGTSSNVILPRQIAPDHVLSSVRVRLNNLRVQSGQAIPYPTRSEIIQCLALTYRPGRDQFDWVTDTIAMLRKPAKDRPNAKNHERRKGF